jgi:tetratricopeptide (TPR) repeat protein
MLQAAKTAIAIVCVAASAFADDEQECYQGHEPQLRIKGCSGIIQRAPNDAAAYHNRAFAYGLVGDVENAIADYSKVIALAPNDASAYSNRSRAYASKGDLANAAEDEGKARELIGKATAQLFVVAPKRPQTRRKTLAAAKHTAVGRKTKEVPNSSDSAAQTGLGAWWSWHVGAQEVSGRHILNNDRRSPRR